MIHEEICTYEVAKLAKEKGFPQEVSRWRDSTSPSRNYYNHKGELNGDCLEIIKCICRKEEVPIELQTIAAPTQSLLQRWLREERGYYVYPFFDNESRRWTWVCRELTGDMWIQLLDFEERYFDTYELALEDALKYALENLI